MQKVVCKNETTHAQKLKKLLAKMQNMCYTVLVEEIYNRVVLAAIRQKIEETPVLLLQGARAVGKSTVLAQICREYGAKLIDFDDPEVGDLFDLVGAEMISQVHPVFIDEYQKRIKILDIIKSRLNKNTQFGQYVISGSSSFDALPSNSQSLTGRIDRLNIYPLAQAEVHKKTEMNPISCMIENFDEFPRTTKCGQTTREQYLKMLTIGGFPLSLAQKSVRTRSNWFENYIEYTINKDIREIAKVRQLDEMRKLLKKFAKATSSVLNIANVCSDIGISQNSAHTYLSLLEKVFMVYKLNPSNAVETDRLTKHPKLHFVDTGIASHLLGINETNVNEISSKVIPNTGALFETFAVNEVIRLATAVLDVRRVGYWRRRNGAEVDLILELWNGKLFAFEVKSGSNIKSSDFTNLREYKQLSGDRFAGGMLLYAGSMYAKVDENLALAPLDCMWM
jgi:predicted AAA+ superfamily ATPase